MNKNINKIDVKVRFNEVDQLGIAHHSHYLIWFEVARFHFLEQALGMRFADINKYGIYLPVVKIKCKFYESVKTGDELLVVVCCENPSASMINFYYEVFHKENMTRIAIGSTAHVRIDTKGRVVARYPDELQKKIDETVKSYPHCYIDSKQARRRDSSMT